MLHLNKNSFRGPLIFGTFEKRALRSGCILNIRLTDDREKLWSETFFSDEPLSFSLKTGTKAHTQNMAKWPRVKLKKKNFVGKESSRSVRR